MAVEKFDANNSARVLAEALAWPTRGPQWVSDRLLERAESLLVVRPPIHQPVRVVGGRVPELLVAGTLGRGPDCPPADNEQGEYRNGKEDLKQSSHCNLLGRVDTAQSAPKNHSAPASARLSLLPPA